MHFSFFYIAGLFPGDVLTGSLFRNQMSYKTGLLKAISLPLNSNIDDNIHSDEDL